MYELCHSEARSKFLSVPQCVAVSKLARTNLQTSGNEVCRALQRFSPNSQVEAGMMWSVCKLVVHQKKGKFAQLL